MVNVTLHVFYNFLNGGKIQCVEFYQKTEAEESVSISFMNNTIPKPKIVQQNKFQGNVPHKYRCEYPLQNNRRLDPAITIHPYQIGFIPKPQSWFNIE